MFGPIKAVIFDFDGTLVDTMGSVTRGIGGAIERQLGRPIPVEDLVATFGAAPQDVFRRWLPEAQVKAAMEDWTAFEHALTPADMLPFAGVAEMLEGLKSQQVKLGIFTGRDREGTLKIAKFHKWIPEYFNEKWMVCGDDGLPTKPQPHGLQHLTKTFALDPGEILMVGDHPFDMQAGQAAGLKTAAALWDLPPGKGTDRSRFREAWTRADQTPCDMRLVGPGGLLAWLGTP